jgi:hypothetical protein
MSLGQLCDTGCEAHLDAKALVVSNPDTTPLYRGERNRATGLWDVDWRNPLPPSAFTSATNEVSAPQASPHSMLFNTVALRLWHFPSRPTLRGWGSTTQRWDHPPWRLF